MSCLDIAKAGLLAVVLRGLACGSAVVRRCSYEALALYSEAVETSNFRSAGLHCLYALCLARLTLTVAGVCELYK